jgi:hypothetical protein
MWVIKLTDKQREVLRAMLRSEDHLGPALRGALEALELARWDELPDAELPWERVIEEARRQGVSEAEVVWDLCGRHPEPAAPKAGAARKAAARRASA